MKNIAHYFIFCLIASAMMVSCAEDKGNYDYRSLDDLGISFDDEYSVIARERFTITPVITANAFDADAYTYEWKAYDNTGAEDPVVLGTELNLDLVLNIQQGTYILVLNITDKATGIYYQKTASLKVSTPTTLGWLVLCSDEGRVRLDMVSHIKSTDNVYRDLLSGTDLAGWQTPYQLVCDPNMAEPFYLVTGSGTTRLSSKDFQWNDSYMIGNEFGSGSYTDVVRSLATHFPGKLFIDDKGHVYYCNTLMGDGLFGTVRSNKFFVSPQIGYNAKSTQIVPSFMMWDKNYRRFVICANEFYTLGLDNTSDIPMSEMASDGFATVNEDLFAWPKLADRMELVHMENTWYDKNRDDNGVTYTILADGNGRYLYGIILGDLYSYTESKYGSAYEKAYYVNLSGCTDITSATHFAFSSLKTYMYYAVGRTVYRVNFANDNPASEVQFVLPDDEEISGMKFYLWQQTDSDNRSYDLIVCSKNTATGESTLRIYDGFDSEGDFRDAEPVEQYGGFADIVDVIYREDITYIQ